MLPCFVEKRVHFLMRVVTKFEWANRFSEQFRRQLLSEIRVFFKKKRIVFNLRPNFHEKLDVLFVVDEDFLSSLMSRKHLQKWLPFALSKTVMEEKACYEIQCINITINNYNIFLAWYMFKYSNIFLSWNSRFHFAVFSISILIIADSSSVINKHRRVLYNADTVFE